MGEDVMQKAKMVVLMGLQEWGQSVRERETAWQGGLDAAGICTTVTVGSDGSYQYTGTEADRARRFVEGIRRRFPLGRFEDEEAMVADAIKLAKDPHA